MNEPCSGGRQRPGRWLQAGRGAARRSAGALPRAVLPGRGERGWLTGSRVRAGVLGWARLCAVTGLLAVVGLAAGAGTGTAQAADALTSELWSGYASWAGPFYSASADFIVPGAICSQGPRETGPSTAFLVGIEGYSGVIQTGFVVKCSNGQPLYYGVHADLTDAATPISEPMQAGDQVDASVACFFGICEESVQDVTENWTDTLPMLGVNSSGDFIALVAGVPSDGGVTTGPVQVTNATMNGTPIGQLSSYEADQEDPSMYSGTAALDPTPLDPTGTVFEFYWDGSTGS
jgi:hypothetical protein